MIVDTREYANMLNTTAGIIRMKISRANGDPLRAGLPGIMDVKKKGNGWIFIVDAKIIKEYLKK